MSEYKFHTTVEPKKLTQLFTICGTGWAREGQTAEEFGRIHSKKLVDFILSGRTGRAFYTENAKGEIGSLCVVTQHPGFYKEADKSITKVPDPASLGVHSATGLRVSFVFTNPKFRGQGLMQRVVSKAIAYVEDDIIKKELAKASDKPDSLKLLATENGIPDKTLLAYYLGRKYVWYLYSGIKDTYKQFGFKSYPQEGYKVPALLADSEAGKFVEELASGTRSGGKTLRFLHLDNQSDRELVSYILQTRELDTMTELQKGVFHLELSGQRRLLLSLSNIAAVLLSAKLGSSNELAGLASKAQSSSSVTDNLGKLNVEEKSGAPVHLQSLILELAVLKFALKPELSNFANSDVELFHKTKICGAVLTNELQLKTWYILWRGLFGDNTLFVNGLGELSTDPMGGRRRLSFTGVNEMGGHNFQDLELLLAAAAIRSKLDYKGQDVHVTINDLPSTVPLPVLHDFFSQYLNRSDSGLGDNGEGVRAAYVKDYADFHLLPMVRRFGNSSPDFELDWVGLSMLTWG